MAVVIETDDIHVGCGLSSRIHFEQSGHITNILRLRPINMSSVRLDARNGRRGRGAARRRRRRGGAGAAWWRRSLITLAFAYRVYLVSPAQSGKQWCERSQTLAPGAREGVLGSVGTFPWLGVLRVTLFEESGLKIALTGIVLVKKSYAIGNAGDIARIPKPVLRRDSRAMFIPAENTPWFCRPIDYMTHPEYELDTLHSIAIVELHPGTENTFPMKPACWPPAPPAPPAPPLHGDNASTYTSIYALGYTDENEILEKFIHKLQYVEQSLCKEFYTRAGLQEANLEAVHLTCGFAPNNKRHCVWDNGIALIANVSGHWILLGLGLRGPGCAAPARFIDLQHYLSWIESSTNVQEIGRKHLFRKTGVLEGTSRRFSNIQRNITNVTTI